MERSFTKQLGQFVEALGLDGSLLGFVAGGLQVSDHLGYQKHHDRVHAERHPVLGGTDGQRVVGRYEDEVVDEETGDGAGDAGSEPTDDHCGDDRHHEHQRRRSRRSDGRGAAAWRLPVRLR